MVSSNLFNESYVTIGVGYFSSWS